MVILYVLLAGLILWYNQPEVLGNIVNGSVPIWLHSAVFGSQRELLVKMLVLVPAVVASDLLPYRTTWNR